MARGKARQQKVKRIPQRTCVGCRQVRPKRELVRIVRTPEGVIEVDPTGKRSGRGAYICPDPKCLELALKGKRLDAALEASVPEGVVDGLMREISSFTGGKPPAQGR